MKQNLPDFIIKEYLDTIRKNTLVKKIGDEYIVSLPFILASGHFVEVFVRKHGQNHIIIRDGANVLSDLLSSGIKILGDKKQILNKIAEEYNLTIEDDEIIVLANIKEVGNIFAKVVEAILRIGDIRLLRKITVIREESIVRKTRKITAGLEPKYISGSKAIIRGIKEPTHMVDFVSENSFPNGYKVAVKCIDVRNFRGLEEKAWAWWAKFEDIRNANASIIRVGIYDEENEIWNQDIQTLVKEHTEKLLPIQQERELVGFLTHPF